MKSNKKELSPKQHEELLRALKDRFEKNMNRHKGLEWAKVQSRICGMEANPEKLWSLNEMERTGGEPDVVGPQKLGEFDRKTSNWIATPADFRERGGALYGEASTRGWTGPGSRRGCKQWAVALFTGLEKSGA